MTREQRAIFFGCFWAYMAAYIARLNLAAALPAMTEALSLTDAMGGLLQTLFAVVYAAGQLVNGAIADRVNARRFIFIGLCGSALCNLLFSFADSYPALCVLWTLNGAAQSMLWTPMVRLMADWFEGELRAKVSIMLSATLIAGHALAWALSGLTAEKLGWRGSFALPAALALLLAFVARALLREKKGARAEKTAREGAVGARMPVKTLLTRTGLIGVLLCCVVNGFIRDGVMTWTPSILSEGLGGTGGVLLTLIIPLFNLAGVLAGRWLLRALRGRVRVSACAMVACCAPVSLLLYFLPGALPTATALLLGLLCAFACGVNPLLASLVPMEYASVGRVALVAGLVDCLIYLGSALAGVCGGAVRDLFGAGALYGVWAIAAAFGGLCMLLSSSRRVEA